MYYFYTLGCCSKNGRYGLFAPSRGGLDLLDLKHGNVVKTLIPKVAEGIFHVIAKFNETDEYVLYYHSGHKSLAVFRVNDGEMIADYRVPSNLTSLESTSDGNHVALGMVDGNVSILTIADPKKRKMANYIRNLPSRQGIQLVITRFSSVVNKKGVVNAFLGNKVAKGNDCGNENDEDQTTSNVASKLPSVSSTLPTAIPRKHSVTFSTDEPETNESKD